MYLNAGSPPWEEAVDGGALRLQHEGLPSLPAAGRGPAAGTVDVAPVGGRIVLFDSRRISHEVIILDGVPDNGT